jgi:outer membrane protein TolC
MKNRLIKLSVMLLVLVAEILPQEMLTLNDAIALAKQNNRYLLIAGNKEKISENNYNIGNAGFLPTVDLSGSVIYNNQEMNNSGIKKSTKSTTNSANISASYTLFDGLSRIYTYSKLKTGAESGKLEKRLQTESIISSVITAYYNVSKAKDQLEIAAGALNISRERLLRTKKKQDYGQAGKIDFLNSRVDFNADSVNYINARTYLKIAKQNLNTILNRELDSDFNVNPEVNFESLPDLNELIILADAKNTETLLSENDIKLAEEDVNLALSDYYPTLSLKASYGYNGLYNDLNISFDNPNKSFSTTLNLNFNLFNGFRNNINKQNAEARLDNSRLLSEQTKLEIQNELTSAYRNYRDSRIILQTEEDNLEAAEANFQRTKELYDLGKITNTEFRQAQLNFVQAKNSISIAKYNAKIYETDLKRISGLLVK